MGSSLRFFCRFCGSSSMCLPVLRFFDSTQSTLAKCLLPTQSTPAKCVLPTQGFLAMCLPEKAQWDSPRKKGRSRLEKLAASTALCQTLAHHLPHSRFNAKNLLPPQHYTTAKCTANLKRAGCQRLLLEQHCKPHDTNLYLERRVLQALCASFSLDNQLKHSPVIVAIVGNCSLMFSWSLQLRALQMAM